ncbi:MAG: sugar transferase [Pirellulales bacterium]|nr:sugar transferase [Pirellulales bacterium]
MDNRLNAGLALMEDSSLADEEAPAIVVADYFKRKRRVMRLVGLLMLLGATPAIALLCLLVRLTSRGPAIFRQVRTGLDGQPFEIWKLRTMYLDAEKATGPVWCSVNDSRITPLGKGLRFLHLDELPQLINVARGEMDLIGPRPERPEIIASQQLLERVAAYGHRFSVLPGVTGLAQINLPADQTIESVHRKVELDVEYLTSASLGLDLRILACTALRMLGVRHGIAVRLFRLDRPEPKRTAWARGARVTLPARPVAAGRHRRNAVIGLEVDGELEAENAVVTALAHKHPR